MASSRDLTQNSNVSVRALTRTYEYGPCVGVTRLERWERAAALGLNPPPEVIFSKLTITRDRILIYVCLR